MHYCRALTFATARLSLLDGMTPPPIISHYEISWSPYVGLRHCWLQSERCSELRAHLQLTCHVRELISSIVSDTHMSLLTTQLDVCRPIRYSILYMPRHAAKIAQPQYSVDREGNKRRRRLSSASSSCHQITRLLGGLPFPSVYVCEISWSLANKFNASIGLFYLHFIDIRQASQRRLVRWTRYQYPTMVVHRGSPCALILFRDFGAI